MIGQEEDQEEGLQLETPPTASCGVCDSLHSIFSEKMARALTCQYSLGIATVKRPLSLQVRLSQPSCPQVCTQNING